MKDLQALRDIHRANTEVSNLRAQATSMVLWRGLAGDGLKKHLLKRFNLGALDEKDVVNLTRTANAQES